MVRTDSVRKISAICESLGNARGDFQQSRSSPQSSEILQSKRDWHVLNRSHSFRLRLEPSSEVGVRTQEIHLLLLLEQPNQQANEKRKGVYRVGEVAER